jgi:uncharacterized UBP type Zn finger protein
VTHRFVYEHVRYSDQIQYQIYRYTDIRYDILIDNVLCENCHTYYLHTQTSHIVNVNQYIFLQIQLWSDLTTKITDLVMNALPNEKINIDGNMYNLHSVIFHHGNLMTLAHYTCIIRFLNKWVDRWMLNGLIDAMILIFIMIGGHVVLNTYI